MSPIILNGICARNIMSATARFTMRTFEAANELRYFIDTQTTIKFAGKPSSNIKKQNIIWLWFFSFFLFNSLSSCLFVLVCLTVDEYHGGFLRSHRKWNTQKKDSFIVHRHFKEWLLFELILLLWTPSDISSSEYCNNTIDTLMTLQVHYLQSLLVTRLWTCNLLIKTSCKYSSLCI